MTANSRDACQHDHHRPDPAPRPLDRFPHEISASLDAITQARIWHLLLEQARAQDIGVVAISHDPELLTAVTDRVIDL